MNRVRNEENQGNSDTIEKMFMMRMVRDWSSSISSQGHPHDPYMGNEKFLKQEFSLTCAVSK